MTMRITSCALSALNTESMSGLVWLLSPSRHSLQCSVIAQPECSSCASCQRTSTKSSLHEGTLARCKRFSAGRQQAGTTSARGAGSKAEGPGEAAQKPA